MLSAVILTTVAEIKLCCEPTKLYGNTDTTSTRVLTVEQAEFGNKQSG
jgi:hypothetical protein